MNGHYVPDNCRWATAKEQGRNKRNNHKLTCWGETKTLAEWAEDPRCLVRGETLRARVRCGWHPEDAVSTANYVRKYDEVRRRGTA